MWVRYLQTLLFLVEKLTDHHFSMLGRHFKGRSKATLVESLIDIPMGALFLFLSFDVHFHSPCIKELTVHCRALVCVSPL